MTRLLILLFSLAVAGCVMPEGRDVIVDHRVGSVYSGNGVLLAISQDRRSCRVAYRNGTMIVEDRWVPCIYVHERPFDDILD